MPMMSIRTENISLYLPVWLERLLGYVDTYPISMCRSPHDSLSVGRREDQKTGADGLGGNFRVHRSRSLSSETALPLRPSLYYRFVSTGYISSVIRPAPTEFPLEGQ